MLKVFLRILVLIFSFACSQVIFAHPLDISSTLITLHSDRASAITYFHPFEAEYLLKKNQINFTEIGDFLLHGDIFSRYLRDNVSFTTNGQACLLEGIQMVWKDAYLVMTEGVELNYSIVCPRSIDTFVTDLRFFTGFTLQTNRLTLLNSLGDQVLYKVATPAITSISYREGMEQKRIDNDSDELSDEEEVAYHTNPAQKDTDGDFYTDYEEVINGWDTLNKAVSPGQSERYSYPDAIIRPTSSISQNSSLPTKKATWISDISSEVYGSDLFRSLMKKVSEFSKMHEGELGNLAILFSLTVLLWFLHAIGPGHAKSVLSSLLVDRATTRKQGMIFALVFSITHIIDIIFMFVLMQAFAYFSDPTTVLSYIQKVSPIILLLLGLYLVVRSVFFPIKNETVAQSPAGKHIWVFGIIMWLAPCTFGWSLFFLLFSLGKIWWIPILIFGVGLGIFLCLIVFVFLIDRYKISSYERFSSFSKHSSIFSSVLILSLGIYFSLSGFWLI